jgi:thimet oligopeptidase
MPAEDIKETPDLRTYREFVLSTLSTPLPEDVKAKILDDSVPLSTFTEAIRGKEALSWPNELRWNIPAEALGSLAQNLIVQNKMTLDSVANVEAGKHTWANTIGAISMDDLNAQALSSSLDFVSDVSTDKAVRDAANVAKEALQAYAVDASSRVDVYKSVKAFSETPEAAALQGEEKRLLEYVLRDFRRDGMELSDADRETFVGIRKKMSSLSIQFHANVGEEDTKLYFTAAELKGLSEEQLKALTVETEGDNKGKYAVSLKTPDYVPVMQFCSVPETRRQLEFAYMTRCIKENTPIMEELVTLRAQESALLGYDTHAAYVLETKMAKKVDTVMEFLTSLSDKIDPLYQREVASVLALKKAECEKTGEAFDGVLQPWDRAYYSRLWEEKEFDIDQEKLKEYFPLTKVSQGLFDIYEQLLNIKFTRVTAPLHAWHDSVELLQVTDAAPGREGQVLGQIYMDLHPRAGKYSHAAVFPLVGAAADANGKRVMPTAGLVCNFPAATADRPALLSHRDVVTFFHEFGHALHHVSSQAKQLRFAGTSVARDFVEMPSQMLENWCYEPASLKFMMGHFKDGSLPDDKVLDNLNRSKVALAGMFTKRQLVFGLLDMRMHTTDKVDTQALYAQVMQEVQHCLPTPGTNMVSAFGHLAGGYQAGYYGYMWSEVFALDAFYTRFHNNLLDSKAGLEYRDGILAKGDSEDADVILERFLGRKPNQEAFLKMKGL